MESFKGTPGPWRIDDKDPTFSALAGDTYHQIKAGHGYHDDEYNAGFGIQAYMSIHDANLIAAAPELLEALQNLISGCEGMADAGMFDMICHGDEIEAANAAINKALGEKQ